MRIIPPHHHSSGFFQSIFLNFTVYEKRKKKGRPASLPAQHDKPDYQEYCRQDKDGNLFDDMEKSKEIAPCFIFVHLYLPPKYAILLHACAMPRLFGRAPFAA